MTSSLVRRTRRTAAGAVVATLIGVLFVAVGAIAPAAAATALSQSSGLNTGGYSITITGTDLNPTPAVIGDDTVWIHRPGTAPESGYMVDGSSVLFSDTEVTFPMPPLSIVDTSISGLVLGDQLTVTVENPTRPLNGTATGGEQAGRFTYRATEATLLSPSSGLNTGGYVMTITGTDLDPTPTVIGDDRVWLHRPGAAPESGFGLSALSFALVAGATELTFTMPPLSIVAGSIRGLVPGESLAITVVNPTAPADGTAAGGERAGTFSYTAADISAEARVGLASTGTAIVSSGYVAGLMLLVGLGLLVISTRPRGGWRVLR